MFLECPYTPLCPQQDGELLWQGLGSLFHPCNRACTQQGLEQGLHTAGAQH